MAKPSSVRVKALREPGRYGDEDGLYLTIRPGGSKSWILRAVFDGRRTDIGLGGYPGTGLAQARVSAGGAQVRNSRRQEPSLKRSQVVDSDVRQRPYSR